ncbi:MAG: hypothetical protein AAGD33_08085 [Actinomycetota bacterium]
MPAAALVALSLDAAKNIAIVVAVIFVLGAVASAWLMKTVAQKVATALVLAVLAFSVWTQRGALDDCADKVTDSFGRDGLGVRLDDTECSFFGFTVPISDPRSDDDSDTE